MTVRELIDKLKTLEQDRTIYVDGYEYGYCDVTRIDTDWVVRDVNNQSWCGPHDSSRGDDRCGVESYIISR